MFCRSVTKEARNQTMFCFPPHLSSGSALPCEAEPRNCLFTSTLYVAIALLTHKTHSNYHLVATESSFIPKVVDCMHQTIKTFLERERSILLSVTHTLYVYQVCHGVGHGVKDGSCSSSSLEWKSMDTINEISYYLNKC